MFRSNRERPGFFQKWTNRFAALIVLGIIIAIILLAGGTCGTGGFFPGGSGTGSEGNGSNDSSNNESEPISSNNTATDPGQTSDMRYSFFMLRFIEDPRDPDAFKSSFAVLVMPDGTTHEISGYTAGSTTPDLDLYYQNLEQALENARQMAPFRSNEFDTIYLEIFRDRNANRVQGDAFVRGHEERVRKYFGTFEWKETRILDELENKED